MIPLTPVPDEVRERRLRTDWYILDTFDALSARYDFPFSESEIANILGQHSLKNIYLRPDQNGVVGHVEK